MVPSGDLLMNTYAWECGGCETKNVLFVEPEDGKQVTIQCQKCGSPWREAEESTNDDIAKLVESLKVAESICYTSMPRNAVCSTETYVPGLAPVNWRI